MCLLIGIILIIKRKSPTYITGRLVGIYILVVSLLMLSHIKYISANEVSGVNIIKDTINNIHTNKQDSTTSASLKLK